MNTHLPKKLERGDTIRILAPSRSLSMISRETRRIANERFSDIGLLLTFGDHVNESDMFTSSSIESRVDDLSDAFLDPTVAGIIAVIGGYNANQLLSYIDWQIIEKNPKVFLGYSDITILQTAILTKARLVTYHGPNYADFGQQKYFDYTLDYFRKCLMNDRQYTIEPSQCWTDDEWYLDQAKRREIENKGIVVFSEGSANGTIIGGNLCTLNLLKGTEYFPNLKGKILFIEEDDATTPELFDRDLQSLLNQRGFKDVQGILIGRFQQKSRISDTAITQILTTKQELRHIPIAYNVDFGHTNPKCTFPIGGDVKFTLSKNKSRITITRH